MQHESSAHGINMSALGRTKQSLNLANEEVAIEVPGLNLFYGEKQALYDVRFINCSLLSYASTLTSGYLLLIATTADPVNKSTNLLQFLGNNGSI